MGIDINSSIANLSVGMSMAKVKSEVSVSLLDKVMTDSANLATGLLEMLPAASISETGGLLDVIA
jgi:hypothetical protein